MPQGKMYREHLETRVLEYSENIRSSILWNGHMNEYENEEFDEEVMSKYLSGVVDQFCTDYDGTCHVGDVVYGLLDAARKYYDVAPKPYKPETIKAILVDYINYVAAKVCMDLAMYTSDF